MREKMIMFIKWNDKRRKVNEDNTFCEVVKIFINSLYNMNENLDKINVTEEIEINRKLKRIFDFIRCNDLTEIDFKRIAVYAAL